MPVLGATSLTDRPDGRTSVSLPVSAGTVVPLMAPSATPWKVDRKSCDQLSGQLAFEPEPRKPSTTAAPARMRRTEIGRRVARRRVTDGSGGARRAGERASSADGDPRAREQSQATFRARERTRGN